MHMMTDPAPLVNVKLVSCFPGRDCTYYKANNDDQQGHVHLVESDPYPALNMQNKSYGGVRIQPAVAA